MDREIEKCDICIVGASIAGNYLCYLLSNTNLNIVIIEEHIEVGFPLQCAGIVSQKLTKMINFPKEIILNRVKVAKIVSPDGNSLKLSGNENPYIIDRVALDQYFYEQIRVKKNIKFLLGEKFKSFKRIKERDQNLLIIHTSHRSFKAKLLVGCDGPLSSVGKSLYIKNRNLAATQIRVSADFDENEAVMYFNPLWKELFGWIVPEGKGIFRIGMACSHKLMRNFRDFLNKIEININQKIDQQAGLIPFGMMNKIAFNNILLLGDSGCQVKSTTGGGIINLLAAAKYAATCIKTCIKIGKYSKKVIKKYYENPCRLTIGRELKTHYLIRTVLERLDSNDFKNLFEIVKTHKINELINLYGDMDFPMKFVLKFLKKPMVFSFFIRFTLKNPAIFVNLLRAITH
jgi:geranylgeranyl reductase family protein